jgi:putative hydrolase of the HAD superfamily
MPNRDCIIFDVGRVLFDFDHERSFERLERLGARFCRSTFFEQFQVDRYERGELSSEEFLLLLEAHLPPEFPREVLVEHWQDIFTPIPEMLALLSRLKEQYCVYLLSNTCELHWQFLDSRFGIESLAHGCVTSFGARVRKPETEIYRYLEQRFALSADNCIFIDDIRENVEAAQKLGWRGVQHRSSAETIRRLDDEFGIRTGTTRSLS